MLYYGYSEKLGVEMQVFVLRDSKGNVLQYSAEIGILFDAAVLHEAQTQEKTRISAENLFKTKAEIKKSAVVV